MKAPEKLDALGQVVLTSRERIVEVATAAFASQGYAGVGMREVADRSGLSKSALFHHFATKLSLYGAVRIAILEDLEARLVAAGPVSDDPMAQLERWLDAVIDALAERPHAAPLLLRSLFEDEPLEPTDAEHSAATLGRILSRGRDALRVGMQSGRFRRVSVTHTMQSIIGMLVFHFASGQFGDQMLGHSKFAPDQVQARKEHVRAVLHGLLSRRLKQQEYTHVAKLMQEQRRLVGDFELIDFLDEKQIAATREKLDVATPLTVRWNHWDYGHEIEELHALYEKGKQFQWNASQALDWDTPVSRDEWLGNPDVSQLVHVLRYKGADEATLKSALFDEINYVLSQLLHGEQAALQICGQLTNACPTNDEKLYAAQQAADEARHSEVLARFLGQKMGTIYPVSPNIKILLEELLRAETYYKKTLGMQTLFEGVAMGILDGLGMTMTNPLLVDMLQRVKLDESRHAAFGVLTMRRCVRDVSEAELHGLEDWTFGILEALNANQQMHMMRTLGPKYGVDPDRWIGKALAFEHWPIMNSGVYMHTVMPNLQRLGLVSERTESKYRKLGMLSDIRQSA